MWLYYPRAIASLEAQEFARREAVGFFGWLVSLLFIPRQILESLELCKSGTHGSNLSPWMVNLISIQT